MGKVKKLNGAVDDGEADSNEDVDAPRNDPIQNQLFYQIKPLFK